MFSRNRFPSDSSNASEEVCFRTSQSNDNARFQMKEAEVNTTIEQALSIFERLSLKTSKSKNSDDGNDRAPRKPPKISFCQKLQQPATTSSYTARLSKK